MKTRENKHNSAVEVVLQIAVADASDVELPTQSDFQRWADFAATGLAQSELCVRIVDAEESRRLNRRYRGHATPTNVLSFPYETSSLPGDEAGSEVMPMGDIVLAAPVVSSEAREQGKRLMEHWAHLFIHGLLHLQGYDHVSEEDARRMEARETRVLGQLGFADPHQLPDE